MQNVKSLIFSSFLILSLAASEIVPEQSIIPLIQRFKEVIMEVQKYSHLMNC